MWSEFESPGNLEAWLALVAKETAGKSLEQLSSKSWEGIPYPSYCEPQLNRPSMPSVARPRLAQCLPVQEDFYQEAHLGGLEECIARLPLKQWFPSIQVLRGRLAEAQAWTSQVRALELDCALAPEPVPAHLEIRLIPWSWLQQGVDAVHELAWSVASLIEHLRSLPDDSPQSSQFSLKLCAGPRLLMEVAKFRAARWLLQQVAEGFALQHRFGLHLIQDSRYQTLQDPHNNLLRSTISALVAHLAGVESVELLGFDASLQAAHLSRNVVHLLRHESHLDQAADFVTGSGTLEELTERLAQRAWAEVQRIESSGGLSQQTDLEQRAALQARAMRERLRQDRQGFVGVNRYVALSAFAPSDEGNLRWAEPFEKLHRQGLGKKVKLVAMGPTTPLLKARQDYVQQWLAMAGLEAECQSSPPPEGPWVLCCEDGLGPQLLSDLKPTVVAGKPEGYLGLAVYRGCDRVEVLEQLLEQLT